MALIDPFRLFAGGVGGFEESRRNNIDRVDGFPESCNIDAEMRIVWLAKGIVMLADGFDGKRDDAGEENGYMGLCGHVAPGEQLWLSR